MNFLLALKQTKDGVAHGEILPTPMGTSFLDGTNWKGFLGDKAERYLSTFLFGAANGYLGPSYRIAGQSPDLVIGGALTVASTLAMVFGHPRAALHLSRIGDAGMAAHIHTWAVGFGADKAGRSKSPSTQTQLKGAVDEVLGAIPPAVGDWLSKDDVLNYKAPR